LELARRIRICAIDAKTLSQLWKRRLDDSIPSFAL